MTKDEIARATDAELDRRKRELFALDSDVMSDDEVAAVDLELDMIWDEQEGRIHDLDDPSSGLGNHQPS